MSLRDLAHKLPAPLQDALRERLYPTTLPEGETVPEWHLQAWDGAWYRHNNRKWTLMVFFPDGQDAAAEAHLRDVQAHLAELRALGVEVYAVNPAEAAEAKALSERLGLGFPLLTDRGGVVARQFKAAVQLPLSSLLLRTVYLVNPDRKIRLANRGTPSTAAIVRSVQALQQATRGGR